jgi:ATP-binding protein involved in chromosome partitioning
VVIVSTPQELALIDVRRGVDAYEKVNAPVIGFVENMAYFDGSGSGKGETGEIPDRDARVYIFGRGGVRKLAEETGQEVLGEVPLDPAVGAHSDLGNPIAVVAPDGEAGRVYVAMTRRILEKVKPFHGASENARV